MRYLVSIPLDSPALWDDRERWLVIGDCESPTVAAEIVRAILAAPSARTTALRVERIIEPIREV